MRNVCHKKAIFALTTTFYDNINNKHIFERRMNEREVIASLALTQVPGIGLIIARKLKEALGSATAVFEQRKELSERVPGVSKRLVDALDCPAAFERAEQELAFAVKHSIRCLCIDDEEYPVRLHNCPDAPLVLFYKGNASLNRPHVINIVGTRRATDYGKTCCRQFLTELKALCPDVLVVSGLAYGIDICAHRSALDNHFETIGVLAHGLDRIYPYPHRDTAARMIHQGGLLTEFMSRTNPDRQNFVQRNRIIAGMSDATIIVESAAKGGSLITADIALSYNRDCFAFPGAVGAPYSEGCNNLIRDNGAMLLQHAEELVKTLRWDEQPVARLAQRELFPELSAEETRIVDLLRRRPEGVQINTLTLDTGLSVQQLYALLFELELKGVVASQSGGTYRVC